MVDAAHNVFWPGNRGGRHDSRKAENEQQGTLTTNLVSYISSSIATQKCKQTMWRMNGILQYHNAQNAHRSVDVPHEWNTTTTRKTLTNQRLCAPDTTNRSSKHRRGYDIDQTQAHHNIFNEGFPGVRQISRIDGPGGHPARLHRPSVIELRNQRCWRGCTLERGVRAVFTPDPDYTLRDLRNPCISFTSKPDVTFDLLGP